MSSNTWIHQKLEKVADLKNGKARPKNEGAIPVYGGNGVLGYADDYNVQGETIIIGRVGAYCGATYFEKKPCWISDNALYAKAKDDNDGLFLYYLLKQKNLNQFAGGSSHPLLTQGRLNDLEVAIPMPVIQKKIARILSSLDEKIELNRQTNQTLEAIAQAIFKEWFVDFNFPGATGEMEESELGMIPKGWRVGKLGDVVELNPKLSLKKGSFSKYVEMKDLSQTSLSVERFIEREFTSGSKFQNGDTLLARITPCLENGKTGFVDFLNDDETGWGSTEFIVMRSKSKSPCFVYCLARLERFRQFAIQCMVGSSGRQRVVESILTEFPLVIPPNELMSLYETKVHLLFQRIKNTQDETKTLTLLRDALLPKLMKGEIITN